MVIFTGDIQNLIFFSFSKVTSFARNLFQRELPKKFPKNSFLACLLRIELCKCQMPVNVTIALGVGACVEIVIWVFSFQLNSASLVLSSAGNTGLIRQIRWTHFASYVLPEEEHANANGEQFQLSNICPERENS